MSCAVGTEHLVLVADGCELDRNAKLEVVHDVLMPEETNYSTPRSQISEVSRVSSQNSGVPLLSIHQSRDDGTDLDRRGVPTKVKVPISCRSSGKQRDPLRGRKPAGNRCCRDAVFLLLGYVGITMGLLLPWCFRSNLAGTVDRAELCSAHASPPEMQVVTLSTSAEVHGASKTDGKFAFVQMAFDMPGMPAVHIWHVLPMARLLQRLSKFPLLVLTNTSHFPGNISFVDAFQKLNVILLPCHEVPLSEKWASKLPKRWHLAYWKLQIWRLTDYEKLIWLDTDTILFRSIDWLFDYDGVWGQRDNWVCDADEDKQNFLCSGLLLIQPDDEIYHGIVRYAETGDDAWYTNGDQKLIRNYFKFIRRTPIKLLSTSDASFGKCIGHTPGISYRSHGPWNMPTFIHKSSEYNECFDHNSKVQVKTINGSKVNICHYNPLGPYWRNLFCEATRVAGVISELSAAYCSNAKWYGNVA